MRMKHVEFGNANGGNYFEQTEEKVIGTAYGGDAVSIVAVVWLKSAVRRC